MRPGAARPHRSSPISCTTRWNGAAACGADAGALAVERAGDARPSGRPAARAVDRRTPRPRGDAGGNGGRARRGVTDNLARMLRFLTAGESHGQALVVVDRGATGRARDHRRGDPGRDGAPPARVRARAAPAVRGRRVDAGRRGAARTHARFAGRDRDQEHRVVPQRQVASRDVAGTGAAPSRRSPRCGPATPISPGCRSTASPMPATCSNGPARARQRPGSRPVRWPRSCSATSAIEIISHVIQMGSAAVGSRERRARRPTTSPRSTNRRCGASTPARPRR